MLIKCLEEPMDLLNRYKEFNWVIESDIDHEKEQLRLYKELQKSLGKKVSQGDEQQEEFDEEGNPIVVGEGDRRVSLGNVSLDSQGQPKRMERKMSVVSKQSKEERDLEHKKSMEQAKSQKKRKSQGDLATEQRKADKKK